MYYKNKENKPYFDPTDEVVSKYSLTKITEAEFKQIVSIKNTLTTEQATQNKIQEAKSYLSGTSWIWEKYSRNVLVLKDLTDEEFNLKYGDIILAQEEARLNINKLEQGLLALEAGGAI